MIVLEYGNERDGFKIIPKVKTQTEMNRYIMDNHEVFYMRFIPEEEYTTIDFGSHYNFYRFKEVD